jgi:hypothetical protein
MKKLLVILLLISCCKSKDVSIKQFHSQNRQTTKTPITNPLFVFTGESNAGGYALNTELTSPQLAIRSAIQIMRNTSEAHDFESLDIGTNNNINHSGLDATTHGIENGLCTAVENSEFSVSTVHVIQTGQGGSRIIHWLDDSSLYNDKYPWVLFKSRIDDALAADSTYSIIIFYSQGINDIADGKSAVSWKTETKAHLAKIRTRYGSTVPIFMTKFYFTGYTGYNTKIDEICAEVPYTYAIETNGFSARDDKHWDSSGYDSVASAFITKIKEYYTL